MTASSGVPHVCNTKVPESGSRMYPCTSAPTFLTRIAHEIFEPLQRGRLLTYVLRSMRKELPDQTRYILPHGRARAPGESLLENRDEYVGAYAFPFEPPFSGPT